MSPVELRIHHHLEIVLWHTFIISLENKLLTEICFLFILNYLVGSRGRAARASSVPPLAPSLRASSVPPIDRGLRASSLAPLDPYLSEYENENPGERVAALSPTPVKSSRWAPRASEVAYDDEGNF